MSKLSKRDYNNAKYPRPLPIPIPLVHISNKYFTPYEVWQSISDTISHIYRIGLISVSTRCIDVVFDVYTDLSFKISEPDDMTFIWDNGFYGKGVLSRSEPTWKLRMERKLNQSLHSNLSMNSDTNDSSDVKLNDLMFSEEVTKQRRMFRDTWKREREAYFALERDIKLRSINGEISVEDRAILDAERERLSKLKDELTKGPRGINPDSISRPNTPTSPSASTPMTTATATSISSQPQTQSKLRMEDYDVIIDSKRVRNIEYLELDPCEAIFLCQLNIIRVKVNDKYIELNELVKLVVETFGPIILNEYIVYYHYRTLGWCVKNGLKFSCDWVLYSRGPPFSHAEFSVKVINENDPAVNSERIGDSLIDYSAIARVVSGVKKTLLLCYVDGPELDSMEWFEAWNEYLETGDFLKLLNSFTINEITWKRWAPSRTRM